MLLHCTKKVAERLTEPVAEALEETAVLGSWHAHLFQLKRRQCLLFCHDETRYMLFLPGVTKSHFKELGRLHRDLFLLSLAALEVPDGRVMRTGLALGPPRFDRATDRSVLGSLNVAATELSIHLEEVDNPLEIDPVKVTLMLNRRPVTARGACLLPEQGMLKKITRL
ncbi:DUF6933 domain-containing protein [Trichloromonas sp.]|uniref:DUF6933 domain-containing protein n=1 Tax=Trichloromonas sp. TaxID=3069249 RepID=UPI003D816A9E